MYAPPNGGMPNGVPNRPHHSRASNASYSATHSHTDTYSHTHTHTAGMDGDSRQGTHRSTATAIRLHSQSDAIPPGHKSVKTTKIGAIDPGGVLNKNKNQNGPQANGAAQNTNKKYLMGGLLLLIIVIIILVANSDN